MKIDYSQLEFLDKKLRLLLAWIEEEFGERTITSLYRINDKGVHGTMPVRGCDIRERRRKRGQEVVDKINKVWKYDPNREDMKCAIIHGKGYNMHIHLQTHPNTTGSL